jgi:hypothetical protein
LPLRADLFAIEYGLQPIDQPQRLSLAKILSLREKH